MSQTTQNAAAGELVPIADRLRYMLGFRALVAVGVGLSILLASDRLYVPAQVLGLATGGFLVLALITHGAWQISRRGGAALFGFMVMVDGAFLAWTAYATGGSISPVRYLIVLELLTVSLLASHRTGMKLAMWHSLLLLCTYYAQKGHVLHGFTKGGLGTPFQQLIAFTAIFWFVAIATSSFSAVNERELRRRRYDLEALAAMATRIEGESDSKAVADQLLGAIVDTFDLERAIIAGSADGETVTLLAHHGEVNADAGGYPQPGEGSVYTAAAEAHRTQLFTRLDPAADAWLDAILPNARNLVVVPLTTEGRTIGALVIEHEVRAGSRIERRVVKMLERFASHGALALRNAWLLEEVRSLAATDALTKLSNRMTFQESLDNELARSNRDGSPVTLLMLDIDHFKKLNDTRGHQAGDDVLRRVAATLKEQRRQYDIAARYGGEEFALILPGLSADDAPALAERVREAIATNGCEVTASLGVATAPADAHTPDALVACADEALYASKHAGRNRVTQWGQPMPEPTRDTSAGEPVRAVRGRPRAPGWTYRAR
jgi:two-component system, cell cycle response regulator